MIAILFAVLSCAAVAQEGPSFPLYNAAQPGQTIPAMGIGLGGYGFPNGTEGECWNAPVAEKATLEFLKAGGRRLDASLGYGCGSGAGQENFTSTGVARAMKSSGVDRKDIFLVTKVGCCTAQAGPGPGPVGYNVLKMGYNETMTMFQLNIDQLKVDYIDLLMIHWPGQADQPSQQPTGMPFGMTQEQHEIAKVDWPCMQGETTYKKCRQETWRAFEDLYKSGKAKAIGVSNFEQNHIADILETGTLKPSVNQIEFHPYWHEDTADGIKTYCDTNKIHFNGYAPLGTPDHMSFHKDVWPTLIPDRPEVIALAKKYNKSPAQVLLRWGFQKGVSLNPRTKDPKHMAENLGIFDEAFKLTDAEMNTLSTLPNTPPKKVAKVCPDPHIIA